MRTIYYTIVRWLRLLLPGKPLPRESLDKFDRHLVKRFTEGNILLWSGGEYVEEEDVKRELEHAHKNPIRA